jgi:hypothetical protein
MTDDNKPVPQPGEAERDDDEVRYFEVDETNVGDAPESRKPHADDAPHDALDD